MGVRASDFLIPEASLYMTHDKVFRSRFAANAQYRRNDSTFTLGSVEYDLDVGLMPFFRRYLFKDPNVEKAQRVTARVGLSHTEDLEGEGADKKVENRGILELTARFPFGGLWLLSDRNKGDFRWVDGVYSARYRNRLRLEHNMTLSGVKLTPYANVEAYYDYAPQEWNRTDFAVGSEFPLKFSMIFELYYTHGAVRDGADSHSIGMGFQKHFVARPRGGT